MLINPKVEITANHEACKAYDAYTGYANDADAQAMSEAIRAVFAVLEREGYHRPDECAGRVRSRG